MSARDPYAVGVYGWFWATDAAHPFVAARLDALLARRLPHVLLCTTSESGVAALARRYAVERRLGLFLVRGPEGVLAQADALALFTDGEDGDEWGPLATEGRRRGIPVRVAVVPGGCVMHLSGDGPARAEGAPRLSAEGDGEDSRHYPPPPAAR